MKIVFATGTRFKGWINPWYPLAARAVHAFASLLEDTLKRNETPPPRHIGEATDCYYRPLSRLASIDVSASFFVKYASTEGGARQQNWMLSSRRLLHQFLRQ